MLAMGVMMILSFLSLAILARSVGSLGSVRRTQDFASALAVADGGVSDALFKIDQAPAATFSNSGTIAGRSWSYTATKVSDNQWLVRSTGTVNGVAHAVEATVAREVLYPYAIFTDQDLTFNGNGDSSVTSYNSDTGATNTHHALIGSNHAITLNGGGVVGDEQDYYSPNGSCSGCANGQQKQGPRSMANPTVPSSTQPCPSGGTFTGAVNGVNGLPYLCDQNVRFSGTVTVTNGPLVVYVTDGRNIDMSDATINSNSGSKAKDFRLFKLGEGTFDVGNGSRAASVQGIIVAPKVSVTVNGGQATFKGSITFNQLRINGAPNFTMAYDDSIATVTAGNWKVGNWREVPSR